MRGGASGGSGPAVARAFDACLALVFITAWLSLGAQIDVLFGERGLLPAAPFAATLRTVGVSLVDAPTLFARIDASQAALHAGIAAGVVLGVLALLGVFPRLCFALGTLLYLSYVVVGRTFTSFQWDNLLLECGLLATFLPRDRRAPVACFCVRVLLFKLYFESGIAKWQSPLGDWQDGSAMAFYYETAPLPAYLAWYAHHLPAVWHTFESWFTLFFELVVPFCIFGPRRARLFALATFTFFQAADIATANYGFFCYLALALHVALLDDADLLRVRARLARRAPWIRRLLARRRWLERRLRRATRLPGPAIVPLPFRGRAANAAAAAYLLVSLGSAQTHFARGSKRDDRLRAVLARIPLVSTYHLFGAITRERIEPEIQTFDGTTWTAHDLRHKPGDVSRAPDYVAPHQPRVDFQLWFYGLSFRSGTPAYVSALLDRACHDPEAIQPLFPAPLPEHPAAARIAFFRYHFTTPEERRATGAWWKRESLGARAPLVCRGGAATR